MISDSDEKSLNTESMRNPGDFSLRGGAESPSFYTPAPPVRGVDTSAAANIAGKNYHVFYSFIEN